MAGNIPGAPTALPGVYDQVETQSSGSAVPGGIRIAAIIGEGSKSETLVAAALGGGVDGLNPSYTSPIGADGRHFALSLFPIISNRTQLFKNGFPLVGIEELIDANPFSNQYDYRVDIATGHIQLQGAYLVDQGGTFYRTSATNVGIGSIQNLTLPDLEAPTETWTIKCISVQRNAMSQPIAQTAKFIATGTVSGNVLDANGNQVVWVANNQVVTNTILSFSINEGATPFREGDSFVIQVKSGVLIRNDSLTASYIPTQNLNDPQLLATTADVTAKHGVASLSNNLSLGCQLAFENGAPSIMCVQAAPAVPRRTSYELDQDGVNANSTNPQDFIYPLPPGVVPDLDSDIHVFVTDPTTNIETQLLPNKFPFYTLGTSGQPSVDTFILDNVNPPSGNSFSYSVIQQNQSDIVGYDGYITNYPGDSSTLHCYFSSASNTFVSADVGDVLAVYDAKNVANTGYYVIENIVNGAIDGYLCDVNPTSLVFEDFRTNFPDFTVQAQGANIAFEVINPVNNSVVTSGTDGYIPNIVSVNSGAAIFSSVSQVNFGGIGGITGYQLKISGTPNNNGLYLITSPSGGSITITKTVTTESSLRYAIIDATVVGQYVVLNHNIVPNNNSVRITYVDERDAPFFDAGWETALAALETQEIDILVTLPKSTISIIFQNAFNHCVTMSSILNRKERIFFTGAINGLTPANLTGAQLAAVEQLGVFEGIPNNDIPTLLAGELSDIANYSVPDAFGDSFAAYRCVYFYPDQIVVSSNGSNTLLDGFYIAAAAAGYLSGVSNVAIPLTKKVIDGFTILRNKQFSPLTLSQLANAGVCTLQPVQGGGQVVWGITTTQSGFVEEREISIVFIRDRIAKSLRSGFAGYIGIAADNNIIETLSARANSLLSGFIAAGLISAYKDLLVVQDSVDPTQWNISVRCQPIYPVNFILVTVSLGLL